MKIIIYSIIISLLFFSCKKDEEFNIDNNVNTARDHVLAENLFTEIQTLIYQAEQGNLDNFREVNDTIIAGCATIIHDTVSATKILSIDYGSTNCLCTDGKYRRGLINASYSGNFSDSGTVVTITTSDYYCNDHKISGTKTVSHMGINGNNHSWYSISENGTVEKVGNSGTIIWNANHIREWIQGESTTGNNWQDDVYEITGTAYGFSADGASFSSIIRDPLQIELTCQQFKTGRIEFTPSTRPIRYINLGDGTCDNTAKITINGNVFEIALY